MKLGVEVNEVVLSNVKSTGEFKIRNSAKAFSILSSGLYSNKIKAIIRELSCNAVDSHVAAGCPEKPFEIHLPTVLEPWFSVRDFGTGLDHDQVTNIYTTYFESTKTGSNDFIGALGLGSKSPFSYTENFTVTAIKDGTQRIYSAFINEQGVPSIARMDTKSTTESNGVEVKFSVTDRYDYNSFRHESTEVFRWFKVKPTVLGVSFEHDSPKYKEENIVPGVHVKSDYYDSSSTALMGNIAYPLSGISEPAKHFGDLAALLECGLVIEFAIGDLDFAASREVLSFVPMTIASIKRKLEDLNASLVKHFAAKADAIPNLWNRAQLLYDEGNSKLYKAAVRKYAADTKFPLYDPQAYVGKKTFVMDVPDLKARELTIAGFHTSSGCFRGKTGAGWSNKVDATGQHIPTINIPVESAVVFVFNDLKTGCTARARYHYLNHNKNASATVYTVSHESDDMDVRKLEYNKLIAELHNPPTIVYASTLQARPVVKRTPLSNSGIASYIPKATSYRHSSDGYKWEPYSGILSDTEKYYYVCLNGSQCEKPDGTAFDIAALKTLMDNSGLAELSNLQIFGVRKSRIKELKDRSNWIWLEDKIKEITAKVSDADVMSLVAYDELDHYTYRGYTSANIANRVGKDSDYAKFVKEIASFKRATTGNVAELSKLCEKYGKTVQVTKVKQKIKDTRTAIVNKYPLIKYCSHSTDYEAHAIEYIKLIDKQETN